MHLLQDFPQLLTQYFGFEVQSLQRNVNDAQRHSSAGRPSGRAGCRVAETINPSSTICECGDLGEAPGSINQTRRGMMDKDRVKGTVDDVAGRAKRQVGEWTGDTKAQVEGAAQQVKGKAEKAWGNVKDAARDAHHEAEKENDKEKFERQVPTRP
jgi:uncharacterized protein YjbJ (UPF0337 family)